LSAFKRSRSRFVIGATAAAVGSTVLLPSTTQAATPAVHLPSPTGVTAATATTAAQAVAIAKAQVGKPYVWGATGPNAFDCSGLVQYAYGKLGIKLPRTTYAQVEAGKRVSVANLRPGDLVFYYSGISHVAIYIGNGKIVHASRPGKPVNVAPLHSMPIAAAVRVA